METLVKTPKEIKEVKVIKEIVLNATVSFKNNFLESYLNWSLASIRRDSKMAKDSIDETLAYLKSLSNEEITKVFGIELHPTDTIYKNLAHRCFESKQRYAATKFNLTLEYLNEADENFNSKIDNLVSKVIEAGLDSKWIRIEKIKNAGFELEFIITDLKNEVHARTIFCNGDIKAPHYRFITTTRKCIK